MLIYVIIWLISLILMIIMDCSIWKIMNNLILLALLLVVNNNDDVLFVSTKAHFPHNPMRSYTTIKYDTKKRFHCL